MWGHSRAEADQIYPGQARLAPRACRRAWPPSGLPHALLFLLLPESRNVGFVRRGRHRLYINSFAALAAFVAPWMMGLAKDATGSFTYGLLALGAVMVIGAFAVLGFAHDGALFGSAARRSGCTCG